MILPDNFDAAERGARARSFFMDGYNCCQAVLMAFADVLEANNLASEDLLKTIGSGFGGGFARMRQVCGSFSACTVMAGFILPATDPGLELRKANYALVQEMAEEFKALNGGSSVCGELLGLTNHRPEGPAPSERTPDYYRKRPCPQIIYNAAVIVAEHLRQ